MNYKEIFEQISDELKDFDEIGQVATYIPALAKANPKKVTNTIMAMLRKPSLSRVFLKFFH